VRILGIDPGSRVTGWAAVDADGWDVALHALGALRLREDDALHLRLAQLAAALRAVLDDVRPEVVAIERVFAAKNAHSALVLGHARGVVLLCAAEAGLLVAEHAPAAVKSSVCGYGRAEKQQVQLALATQLGLRELPRPLDASDALAVAVAHAASARLERRLDATRRARP
jgi:crossover junction endodeoxyribonuclease RuvC